MRFAYTWGYHGTPQEGELVVGFDEDRNAATAYWIDSWPMGNKIMACAGDIGANGRVSLRGSYAAPPGPDWDWRIEIVPEDGTRLRLLMVNIAPDGSEELAVESQFARA